MSYRFKNQCGTTANTENWLGSVTDGDVGTLSSATTTSESPPLGSLERVDQYCGRWCGGSCWPTRCSKATNCSSDDENEPPTHATNTRTTEATAPFSASLREIETETKKGVDKALSAKKTPVSRPFNDGLVTGLGRWPMPAIAQVPSASAGSNLLPTRQPPRRALEKSQCCGASHLPCERRPRTQSLS